MPVYHSQGRDRLEPDRHDQLSDGVPATEQANADQERTHEGRFAKGASTLQRRGGKALKNSTRMSHTIGSIRVSPQQKKRAKFYRRKQCTELAQTVGAGHCGMMASLLVKLASEDIALREAALERDDVELATRLGANARQHLLYAREIVAKDGESRKRMAGPADLRARILGTTAIDDEDEDEETETDAPREPTNGST